MRTINGSLLCTAICVACFCLTPGARAQAPVSPAANNNSNLGSAPVCQSPQTCAPASAVFNYNIGSEVTFGAPLVVTQGIPNLDFTLAANTCSGSLSGGQCSVTVNFTPTAPGLRMGAIQLFDNNSNLLNTTYISGVGQSPSLALNSGTLTKLNVTGLQSAQSLAVDAAGNLFILDASGDQILKYAPSGQTSQIATGLNGVNPNPLDGLAVDGAGNLFFSEYSSQLMEIPAGSNTATRLSSVNLSYVVALAVDAAGNVWISNVCGYACNTVVKVPPGGGTQTDIGGFRSPDGIAVDAMGNVYVADSAKGLFEIPAGGTTPTLLSNLTYLPGKLNSPDYPNSVALDAAGNIYAGTSTLRLIEYPAGVSAPTTLESGEGSFTPNLDPTLDPAGNLYIINGGQVFELPRAEPPLTFAPENVGTNSSQTATAQNIGNQPLTVTGFSTDPNFSASASTCTSVAPGGFCNLTFSFMPTELGPLTGSLTPMDNVLSPTTQSFPLSVTGIQVAPGANLGATAVCASAQSANCGQSAPLDFIATVPLGTPQVVTQGMTGLDFNLASTTCGSSTLACSVTVKFTPLAPGLRMGAIRFVDANGNLLSTTYIAGVGQGAAITPLTQKVISNLRG